MTKPLMQDERFLRIRKLNSGGNRRRSIALEQEEEEKEEGLEVVQMASLDDLKKSSDEGIESSSGVSRGATPDKGVTTATGGDSCSGEASDEENIKLRLRRLYNDGNLSGPEKRYSFFGDVAFDYRPSILDGSINDPMKTRFEGPTLEKQIRAKKRAIKLEGGNGHVIIDNGDLSPNFSGLYVLFWLTVAFMSMNMSINYYYEHGRTFRDSAILKFMTTDVFTVGFVDLLMYLNIYMVFFIHKACKSRLIKWSSTGMAITSIMEFAYLIFYLYLPEHVLRLHWLAKIFLFLHSLVLLMKMHSYAFYNGYMWNILEELNFSTKQLKRKSSISDPKVLTVLERSRSFCKSEIESQSSSPEDIFPNNINLKNFFMYTMYPTVVYQIEYPRTPIVRWGYVFEKLCAIFGTIFVMMALAQSSMYPLAMKALSLREKSWLSATERLQQWGVILIEYIPSFIVMYLLVFYLIWDAILNCIAELSRFGDRYFYGDWWNCVSWDEFSRIWNVPIHKFLLRHVYHSSMSALQLNKTQATLMTFLLSSVVHELSMYVLFRKLRFYLFFFQMGQLPLVALSSSKLIRRNPILGNLLFWIGICTGPSVLCTMYLTF
ncbi:hypothetical protein ZYGR_0AK03760 [Zygosaccharomyces rouxii]|uniref:O-acyltransferase n=1 Tax=Zygosaccharomyces rouxii TaxID=4956 RepID=B2G3W6_ZYGRO|nr:hypothetical protein ZYGR_0AK03760 [Zygosaccharomyces rouxii]CAQ43275.1 Sterol O-acyltransferase 1 and Sterol O-acyltransferase 2 [Zygosaccharomyces rouxii]